MVGRLLKVAGLMGGGILAIGVGALGTHAAYPTLESNFFPQRKEKEEKLKQLLEERKQEIEALTIDLSSQTSLNELQTQNISTLEANVKKFTDDLDTKKKEVDGKDNEIRQKEEELNSKKREYEQQKTQKDQLETDLNQKTNSLNDLKKEKTEIEENLTSIKKRLDLTKEDILTEKTLQMDLLKIDLRKIEHKGFDGTWSEFEITNHDNTKTKFKVHKDNKTNQETVAEDIRKKGILFGVNKTSLGNWNKKIKITRFDADFVYKTTDEKNNRCYVKSANKQTLDWIITEYVKNEYLEEAFKVYMAITKLDYFPLSYDLGGKSENLFHFFKGSDITQSLTGTDVINWSAFSSQEDFFIYTDRFNTIDDFLKYWANKTVEFVRTGTVDFFDFLNPINRSKNYTSSS